MEIPKDAKILINRAIARLFKNISCVFIKKINKKIKNKTKKEHLMCFTLILFYFRSSLRVLFMHLSQKKKYQMPKEYVYLEQQRPQCYIKCAKKKSNHYQYQMKLALLPVLQIQQNFAAS